MLCAACDQEKEETDFYASNKTSCKECVKARVRENYRANRAKYQEYEIRRAQDPQRKRMALMYQRDRRRRRPEKEAARRAIAYHLRVGNITRKRCEVCGVAETEAHHTDYSKPLDVMWLCRKHHLEQHNKEAYESTGSSGVVLGRR